MALPIDAGKITVGLSGATIEEQHGRGMIGNMTAGLGEAQRMLEAFGSVGAQSFDITWTNTAGDPRRPRTLTRALQSLGGKLPVPKNPDWLDSVHIEGMGIDDLARTLPAMLGTATAERLNLIVRPYGDDVTLMQLDDLDSKKLARVAPAIFLSIETSPGNFQAGLALVGSEDKDFTRRVKRGAEADMGASGATRIAGSLNLKQKYAPNYPRVAIREVQPRHVTNAAELERLGLVAPPEEFAPLPAAPARFEHRGGHIWPSYEVAVGFAPMNRAGTDKDYSAADIGWNGWNATGRALIYCFRSCDRLCDFLRKRAMANYPASSPGHVPNRDRVSSADAAGCALQHTSPPCSRCAQRIAVRCLGGARAGLPRAASRLFP
jgi:hypothetical protein